MRRAHARTRRTLAVVAAATMAAVMPRATCGQGLRRCASLAVADPEAAGTTPGALGALLDVDTDLPPASNTTRAGAGALTRFLSSVAVATGRGVFMTDLEADPSNLGQDPNGNPGRGAVFFLDAATGGLVTVADGTRCGSNIPNCDPSGTGVFVDPVGIAWSHARTLLAIVDVDSDPAGLGPDSNGFAGHGAVLSVDPTTGTVDLISDGTRYPPGLPVGPSIFEDPVALAFDRAGNLYVVDQLARPSGTGSPGAVFGVDDTGFVNVVAFSQQFAGLRDIAAEPSGTLLVLDRLAGGNGMLFRIDPTMPPTGAIVAQLRWPQWVEPAGVVATGSGRIFVIDTSADPFAVGTAGAIFEVDPTLRFATVLSATTDYASPWSLDKVDPEALDLAVPAQGSAGTTLDVNLFGGVFVESPTVDFGPGITVSSVTFVSPQQLVVNITISPLATAGLRDVRVDNPDITYAFHCELFEVLGVPGCAPAVPVGPSLRVSKPEEGTVRLAWEATGDSCTAGYRVYRAFTAFPSARPGLWHDDPEFENITLADADMDWLDSDFVHAVTPGRDEYYLVVPVGTNGEEGPVGHYGR